MLRWSLAFLAAFWSMGVVVPAEAQNRLALVLGIDSYENVPKLQKARNDATAVAAALEGVGFGVTLLTDATRRELNATFAQFAQRIQPGDEALFYFAGHGVEIDGHNYLLAKDLPALKPGDDVVATTEGIEADWILSTLQSRGARVTLLILDACRDNPFPIDGTRSLGSAKGLMPTPPPFGAFVLYSAGKGERALDGLQGEESPNSVFTRNLLPLISQEGLPIDDLAKLLRRQVIALAESVGHSQHPAYYDELTDDYLLVPAAASGSDVTPTQEQAAEPVIARPSFFWLENFDDSVLNTKGWHYHPRGGTGPTDQVSEHDGYLDIQTLLTDKGGMATLTFPVSIADAHISLDRFYHAANEYFFSSAEMTFTEASGETLSINFLMNRSAYPPDNGNDPANFDHPKIVVADASGYLFHFARSLTTSSLLDTWVTTEFRVNNTVGSVNVDVNHDGVIDIHFVDPRLVGATLRSMQFDAYGWYTGHFAYLDNLSVTGIIAGKL